MLVLLLLALLVYSNVRIAISKGLSPLLWGVLSFVAFVVTYLILGAVYFLIVYHGAMNTEAARAWAEQNPVKAIFMIMLGIGGVLIVRYILERKPSKKQ